MNNNSNLNKDILFYSNFKDNTEPLLGSSPSSALLLGKFEAYRV